MASLHAKHARSCALTSQWTKPDNTEGCTCEPVYYVIVRQGRKTEKIRTGRNRRSAERALRKIGVDLDAGTYVESSTITVAAWLAEWHSGLRRPKESTKWSYVSTMNYATEAFGIKRVRDVRVIDIELFLRLLDARGLSASTQAKHLRVLGAVFECARKRGLTGRNPVRDLDTAARPRPERREAAYFDDDELRRLETELADIHRTAFELSLKSGIRQAEAIALRWADVDLATGVIRIRQTWTRRGGPVTLPKSNEIRDVHITSDLIASLGLWWGQLGRPSDHVLVLPGERDFLSPFSLLGQLRAAMRRAGVPVLHPKTETTRNWHSLRHSYARIALEAGADIYWLQKQLGHADLQTTIGKYGHFSQQARRREADRLEGAFVV